MSYLIFFIIYFSCLTGAGIKWELNLKIIIIWNIIMTILGCIFIFLLEILFNGIFFIIPATIALILCGVITVISILIRFYSDPLRVPPAGEHNAILSPADGKVIYIKEIKNGEFPFSLKKNKVIPLKDFIENSFLSSQKAVQIGIAMNFLDVHINRTPISGRIAYIKPIHGQFKSLKHLSSLLVNERAFTLIENNKLKIGIVQIASRLVRRIIPFVKEGDVVQQAQRMGTIRFGSQVDVIIPYSDNLEIVVKDKQHVKAGESILARLT